MAQRTLLLLCVVVCAFAAQAQDFTPPVITPQVSGTEGNNGYYTSDVAVTWTVVDAESSAIVIAGCNPEVIDFDTPGETLICSAGSLGGVTTSTYTIKRDSTAPVVSYSSNATTFSLDQNVTIFCDAFDALSGVATTTCQDVNAPALSFGLGTHTLSATATDNAGNQGSGSFTFTVAASVNSINTLIDRYVTKPSVAKNLQKRLERGDILGFIKTVQRESGKSISPEHAAELVRLVLTL
jgi:HYR domain